MNIKFVYEAVEEVQESLPFTKVRKSKKYVPNGKGHIFKVKIDGELQDKSMCGISKYEVSSTKTLEKITRVEALPVCSDCANTWKEDSDSEWKKWVKDGN